MAVAPSIVENRTVTSALAERQAAREARAPPPLSRQETDVSSGVALIKSRLAAGPRGGAARVRRESGVVVKTAKGRNLHA
ncbi:hypothetical protein SKAU_G00337980 [Synaphobranchus kaupii]|uniref:Uncharacterized protein n=1 Tax=Synaphobranchus kaupii TaxID=118154 RepID=A0A9Q1IIX6_SYNKA|nr:hypothetical protein SKAU_G00337980 [Synaphobranchus kaupii]